MQVSRKHVIDILRTAGYLKAAEEAAHSLPDPVEYQEAESFVARYGITKDALISRMGGSP